MRNNSFRRGFYFSMLTAILFTPSSFTGNYDVIVDTDIVLPKGFTAEVVVNELGANRHLVVNNNGDIYVKLAELKNGKGILVFRKNNDRYETVKSFGNYTGTGITIKNGYLYASSDEEVFRYKLNASNEVTNPDNPEKIVTGLLKKDSMLPSRLHWIMQAIFL